MSVGADDAVVPILLQSACKPGIPTVFATTLTNTMVEHTFGLSEGPLPDDASATARAAELAEQILDEITRARHSWRAIELLAVTLARLAGGMVRPGAAPPSGPPRA